MLAVAPKFPLSAALFLSRRNKTVGNFLKSLLYKGGNLSGIYVLLLATFWILIGWGLFRLAKGLIPFQSFPPQLTIAVYISIFLLWFGIAFWKVTGKKLYWDYQINVKCEVDGGNKVYETIELPKEKFDKWGYVNFYAPIKNENALGPEFVLKRQVTYFRKSNPTLVRVHYEISHSSSQSVIGETVRYSRRGGDFPGPWMGSSYACPSDSGIKALLKAIFKETENEN